MQKSGNLQKFRICLLFGLCVCLPKGASAQFGGGFSPERMFSFYDQDGNGRIEGEELDRIRGPIREILEQRGIDPRRGLSERDLTRAFEEMRGRMEESRERGEGFGGRGFGDRGGDRESGDRGRGRGSPRTASAVPAPPPRVTMDLPSTFAEGDIDGDGQIAFWEWRIWKRGATAEFYALDHNGDGFLTPQELVKGPREDLASLATPGPGTTSPPAGGVPAASPASPASPVSRTTGSSSPSGSSRTVSSTSRSNGAVSGSSAPSATASTTPGSAELDSPAARQAASMFRLLDKDRDGNLSPTEWNGSRRQKDRFEQAGINLQQPMSRDEFIAHYVRLES